MRATILVFPRPTNIEVRERNRARIACHRNGDNFRFRSFGEPICDLTQRCADPEDTAPAEYSAPAHDGA